MAPTGNDGPRRWKIILEPRDVGHQVAGEVADQAKPDYSLNEQGEEVASV